MDSESWAAVFGGCLLTATVTGLISAFVFGDTVRQATIEKGQVLCANNNGLKQIDAYFYSDNVICVNGAVFNVKEIL